MSQKKCSLNCLKGFNLTTYLTEEAQTSPHKQTNRLTWLKMELIDDQGLRLDGRLPSELRRVSCKMGVFDQPDGSAYVEQGSTKVLAAVYGPHQAPSNKSDPDEVHIGVQYSTATFAGSERKTRPRGDRKSLEIKYYLKQAIKNAVMTKDYPRSQINIYVEVLQRDGSEYAVALNAVMLALIDAGVALREYIIACTASLDSFSNTPLLDVSLPEETAGGPTLTIGITAKSNKIAFMEMSQRFHVDYLPLVVELAEVGCRKIQTIMEADISKHISYVGSLTGFSKTSTTAFPTH